MNPITSTQALMNAMRQKYCLPEWVLFENVANSTGFGGKGYADAVAMNTYPSRGLLVHGFELKVSRGDWLRELRQPAKAETLFEFCDHWWLVAGDRALVKDGELPAPWGLIAPNPRGEGLAIIVQAPKLEPKPLTRGFVAALARRAAAARDEDIGVRVEEAVKSVREECARSVAYEREHANTDYGRLRKLVFEFEQAAGIKLTNTWRGGKEIGETLKLLLDKGAQQQRRYAEDMLGSCRVIERQLTELLKRIPPLSELDSTKREQKEPA